MKRRLIGGFLVAVVIALALSQTAEAFVVGCYDFGWWNTCWPF